MADLLLAGGHQGVTAGALDRDHERLYDQAIVAGLNTQTGALTRLFTYTDAHADSGQVFKGMSWDGALLLLCTERELVWVDPATWMVVRTFSHRWMNDLHHAKRIDETVYVVSTGCDGVLEIAGDDVRFVGCASGAFAPAGDVRLSNTKPHIEHPNHLVEWQGLPWVTRLHSADCVQLHGPGRIEVADVGIHDGVAHGGALWFTAVDGRIIRATMVDRQQILIQSQRAAPLGWCRGLHVTNESAFVGFTRIRATRLRSNLAWMRGVLRGRRDATMHPTRVCEVHVESGHTASEWEVESVGLSAVFAILSA